MEHAWMFTLSQYIDYFDHDGHADLFVRILNYTAYIKITTTF